MFQSSYIYCSRTKPCDPYNTRLNIAMVAEVPYIMNAVNVVVEGLQQALETLCGHNYTKVCTEARNNMNLSGTIKDIQYRNIITNNTMTRFDGFGCSPEMLKFVKLEKSQDGHYLYEMVIRLYFFL